MKVLSTLNKATGGMSSIYKLLFTTLLVYELLRFRFRREPHEEIYPRRPHNYRR